MPRHTYKKTRQIALSGLLFALAMALSFVEGTLVIPGLLPGMKLGLANIVVMYALFFMGPGQALALDLLKAGFVFLVSGPTAGFLSFCGGMLSLLVMWLLYYVLCPGHAGTGAWYGGAYFYYSARFAAGP